MKNRSVFTAGLVTAVFIFLFLPLPGWSQDLEAIVSTQWLENNLSRPDMVILDVRKVEDYRNGHIVGAVNLFYRAWAFKKKHLYAEIPDQDDLSEMIGSAGISPGSRVVVVGSTGTPQEKVHGARVACTLKFAGVKNVAILDGGFEKWTYESRKISKMFPKRSRFLRSLPARSLRRQGIYCFPLENDLLDVREKEYYLGKRSWIVLKSRQNTELGIFRLHWHLHRQGPSWNGALASLASVVGQDRDREIVTYCDTGHCCPTGPAFERCLVIDSSTRRWRTPEVDGRSRCATGMTGQADAVCCRVFGEEPFPSFSLTKSPSAVSKNSCDGADGVRKMQRPSV